MNNILVERAGMLFLKRPDPSGRRRYMAARSMAV